MFIKPGTRLRKSSKALADYADEFLLGIERGQTPNSNYGTTQAEATNRYLYEKRKQDLIDAIADTRAEIGSATKQLSPCEAYRKRKTEARTVK